jgi:hypothetical protein
MVSSEHGEDRDDHQHLMQPTWAPGFDQSRPAGSRGSAGSMPGLQGPTMSGSLRVGIARRCGRNRLRPKRRRQRCRLRFVRRGSPVTRRSAPQGTKSAPGRTAPSGSLNAATRHTGLTRPRHGCEGRTTPVRSHSKREKTGANHNQAHNDKSKETGRSNIFAHDDTYASIRQNSLNHQFVSGCLRRTQKTTSSAGSTVTCSTPHEASSRPREPRGHRVGLIIPLNATDFRDVACFTRGRRTHNYSLRAPS